MGLVGCHSYAVPLLSARCSTFSCIIHTPGMKTTNKTDTLDQVNIVLETLDEMAKMLFEESDIQKVMHCLSLFRSCQGPQKSTNNTRERPALVHRP